MGRLELWGTHQATAQPWHGQCDTQDDSDQTLLKYATKNGHKVVLELSLDTNEVDTAPWSRLEWTQFYFRTSVRRRQFGTNAEDNSGRTPLWWAIWSGHEAVVEQLVESGKVDVNSKNDGWYLRSGPPRTGISLHSGTYLRRVKLGKIVIADRH